MKTGPATTTWCGPHRFLRSRRLRPSIPGCSPRHFRFSFPGFRFLRESRCVPSCSPFFRAWEEKGEVRDFRGETCWYQEVSLSHTTPSVKGAKRVSGAGFPVPETRLALVLVHGRRPCTGGRKSLLVRGCGMIEEHLPISLPEKRDKMS